MSVVGAVVVAVLEKNVNTKGPARGNVQNTNEGKANYFTNRWHCCGGLTSVLLGLILKYWKVIIIDFVT